MATYIPSFPLNFTEQGDTTTQAIYKACTQEINRIYGILNVLMADGEDSESEQEVERISLSISGVANSVATLPISANEGAVYYCTADNKLYTFRTGVWSEFPIYTGVQASPVVGGSIKLGTLSSLTGLNPRTDAVVTEAMLAGYNSSLIEGLPAKTIAIWNNTPETIPPGWQICDGTNGTPDLQDRFVTAANTEEDCGTVSGVNVFDIPVTGIKSHTHQMVLSAVYPSHSHQYSATGTSGGNSHVHTVTVGTSSMTYEGGHFHGFDRSVWGLYSKTGTGQWASPYHAAAMHTVVVNTAGASPASHTHSGSVSGAGTEYSASHYHQYSFYTSPSTGGASAVSGRVIGKSASVQTRINTVPKSLTVFYIMKLN